MPHNHCKLTKCKYVKGIQKMPSQDISMSKEYYNMPSQDANILKEYNKMLSKGFEPQVNFVQL
jgi:hypothetical protein